MSAALQYSKVKDVNEAAIRAAVVRQVLHGWPCDKFSTAAVWNILKLSHREGYLVHCIMVVNFNKYECRDYVDSPSDKSAFVHSCLS